MKFLGFKREELSVLSMENEMIGKAVGKLKELSEDERVRMIYEEREKARMDYQSGMKGAYDTGKEAGIAEGIEKGIAEGIEKGIAEGIEKGIAKGMEKWIEKWIEMLIIDNLEEKVPEERILQKLQKRFELSEKEAKIRLEKYRRNF